MSSVALDPVRQCLSQWRDEQTQCESELRDSFEALAALESNLGAWQTDLAQQRESLRHERMQWEQRQSEQAAHSDDALQAELQGCLRRVSELETQLSHKEQELRQLKDYRNQEAPHVSQPPQQHPPDSRRAAPAADGNDPVLGSIVAQFGKLRKQRAERGFR